MLQGLSFFQCCHKSGVKSAVLHWVNTDQSESRHFYLNHLSSRPPKLSLSHTFVSSSLAAPLCCAPRRCQHRGGRGSDLAHIPHTCNEENKSFGVIPDLQLFRHTHKLIYLNGRGHDRKYTKLMTVTLNVIQKKIMYSVRPCIVFTANGIPSDPLSVPQT